MHLTSLQLENFKNYRKLSVDLTDKSLLILVGKNGHGKTNFLEAIVILALSKSFHGVRLKEMVNWYIHEEDTGLPEVFRIAGHVESKEGKHDLEVICGKTRSYPKTLKIDDVKTKPKDYVGHLRVVLFTPRDLNMVMLSPQIRRRYVNILISQIDPEYLAHLSSYQGVIKQRNALLKRIKEGQAQAEELVFWDEQIVEHGGYLLWKRRQVFSELNDTMPQHYEAISQEEVALELQWTKQWEGSLEEIRTSLGQYLEDKRSRDIEVESTCGGPHREDFAFMMNKRPLADFGSRGECRSAILALKLSELETIKKITGDSPVLLFDDVFSELDIDRQQNLLKLFQADQVFISTTHLDYELPEATVWSVVDGNIQSDANTPQSK